VLLRSTLQSGCREGSAGRASAAIASGSCFPLLAFQQSELLLAIAPSLVPRRGGSALEFRACSAGSLRLPGPLYFAGALTALVTLPALAGASMPKAAKSSSWAAAWWSSRISGERERFLLDWGRTPDAARSALYQGQRAAPHAEYGQTSSSTRASGNAQHGNPAAF